MSNYSPINQLPAGFVNDLPPYSKPASASITITVQEKSGVCSVCTVTGVSLDAIETRLSSMLLAITSAKARAYSSQNTFPHAGSAGMLGQNG